MLPGPAKVVGSILAAALLLGTSASAFSEPLEDLLAGAAKRIKPTELKAAAARQKARIAAARQQAAAGKDLAVDMAPLPIGPGDVPDYYATPNWAFSPPLRKFVDPLPGLWDPRSGGTAPAKCIPLAVPDTITYPGSDYYEIELRQYTEQMHSDLGPSTLRGYVQVNNGTNAQGVNAVVPAPIRYLGPVIVAQKDRPVRIKFINKLPTGSGGDLFLPVDTTIMGSGPFEINYDPNDSRVDAPLVSGTFAQNRGELHLHGGRTPWISDGTPHQWITPDGDSPAYPHGVSLQNVPDMPDPGPGAQTYYWTNQQSGRFMFYHDHAWGITRLNVYAGEAAGYLIQDPAEQALVYNAATNPAGPVPADMIPLVIQDKTFVNPATIAATDPTWAWGSQPWNGTPGAPMTPVLGDLWWPHVYMPAQNPYNPDLSGINAMGRWHYGPWFFPATPLCFANGGTDPLAVPPFCVAQAPKPNPYFDCWQDGDPNFNAPGTTYVGNGPCTQPAQPPEIPGTPNVSWGAEAFLDTVMVNGAAYPTVTLDPKAYRFRILNAAHDRFLNLQLYKASPIVSGIALTSGGSGYAVDPAPVVTIAGTGTGATAEAVVAGGIITAATVDNGGTGYSTATVTITGDGTGALATATIAAGVVTGITIDSGGSGYTTAAIDIAGDGTGALATATIDPTGPITAINLITVGSGYTAPPTVTITGTGTGAAATATVYTAPTEVGMVPAAKTTGFPALWPGDGREGGVPDPAKSGPAFIQIGTEGGFLPVPVLLRNQPVSWNLDPTMFNVGNVLPQPEGGGTVILGPAERADVIVDFSQYAGQTLILYNDAPTAFPALDPHYDYYTNAPDRTDIGGSPAIPPGVGPNVRTVMQIVVSGSGGAAPANAYNATTLSALKNLFKSSGTINTAGYVPGVFATSQEPIIVGQKAYNTAYNYSFPTQWPNWGVSRISDTAVSFKSVTTGPFGPTVGAAQTLEMGRKAIHDEMGATFDDYGRMSAKLGLQVSLSNAALATFALQNYVDPPTELVAEGQTQIWRINHNGVDTHPIHFHLFDVQILNRVGWDGFIRLPDPNELGWKDTVRMSPLEDTIVALRPTTPKQPFGIPTSNRPLNPAVPLGSEMGFSQMDPLTGGVLGATQVNERYEFGWEYVWHCHILSHEENDMMRPIAFAVDTVLPSAPTQYGAVLSAGPAVKLSWSDLTPIGPNPSAPANLGNPANEIGFKIERCTGVGCTSFAPYAKALANQTSFTDTGVVANGTTYRYRVIAYNASGDSVPSNLATISIGSNQATGVTLVPTPVSPAPAGSSISFLAGATGGDAGAGGIFQYRFFWRASTATTWTQGRAYGLGTTWVWDTSLLGLAPGTYFIQVYTRHQGSSVAYEAVNSLTYLLTAPVNVATGVTLSPSLTSPRPTGTAVTFTAGPTGGDPIAPGVYEYRFWTRAATAGSWSVAQIYSLSNTFLWDTAALALPMGTYYVMVDVRHVGNPVNAEATRSLTYLLTSPSPATGATFAAAPTSPRPVGTAITLTTTATGGDAGPYEYRYQMDTPTAGTTYVDMRGATYGSGTLSWTTVGLIPGTYSFRVYVRHAGSPVASETIKFGTFVLQ
jgi:FtsP/CotA-like multicopper oxidase with cupredoxin domain